MYECFTNRSQLLWIRPNYHLHSLTVISATIFDKSGIQGHKSILIWCQFHAVLQRDQNCSPDIRSCQHGLQTMSGCHHPYPKISISSSLNFDLASDDESKHSFPDWWNNQWILINLSVWNFLRHDLFTHVLNGVWKEDKCPECREIITRPLWSTRIIPNTTKTLPWNSPVTKLSNFYGIRRMGPNFLTNKICSWSAEIAEWCRINHKPSKQLRNYLQRAHIEANLPFGVFVVIAKWGLYPTKGHQH